MEERLLKRVDEIVSDITPELRKLALDIHDNPELGNEEFKACQWQTELLEKYVSKGQQLAIEGRIQTGSYTNKDGVKVYTTEVVVEDQEFAESKNSSSNGGSYGDNYSNNASAPASNPAPTAAGDGFMNIPDGIEEELPFN